jgi:ATPase subunit of ABC transporter with duplicated ATPase domains
MPTTNLLHAHKLTLHAPGGRPLFRELTLILDRGDRVALIGRNGIGKSTLLAVLAGTAAPDTGEVVCHSPRAFVPQGIEPEPEPLAGSPGERRRRRLQQALDARPDLLLLDEPTHDLDQPARDWLASELRRWRKGLIVVSHDRRLLREFGDFFLTAESGCRHFHGSFDALLATLAHEQAESERAYVRQLERLSAHEQRQFLIRQRRQRKKNVGRVRELRRGTPRILLNSKRSYAQEKQAKRDRVQQARIQAARDWAAVARRSLAVELPLSAVLPRPADAGVQAVVRAKQVSARCGDRVLFQNVSLELGRRRLAVTGPNGSGKTTLLELLAGVRRPDSGQLSSEPERIGYIAQNAANWCLDESLLSHLLQYGEITPDAAASCMRAHRFPLALAQRPLRSLSPGERLRAALICILQRTSAPELLILDEPTSHLDLVGHDALQRLLQQWTGGLVVASHDEEFLVAIGVDERLALGDKATVSRSGASSRLPSSAPVRARSRSSRDTPGT